MSERIMGWDCPECGGRMAVAYEWDDGLGVSVIDAAELTPEVIFDADMDDPEKTNCTCTWNDPSKSRELQQLVDSIGWDIASKESDIYE